MEYGEQEDWGILGQKEMEKWGIKRRQQSDAFERSDDRYNVKNR